MIKNRVNVVIPILSLILLSTALIQTSYSQPTQDFSGSPSASKYSAAREQFLKVWDTLEFQPLVATFVNASSRIATGVYQEHSNVFAPGETILLYLQPIGFGAKEIQGPKGEKSYLINFTADVALSRGGEILASATNLGGVQIISHIRNTELFTTVSVTQTNPFPTGDYSIKYTLNDKITGKKFELTKNITIA